MIRIGLLGAAKIAPKAIIEPAAKREDAIIVAIAARDSGRAADFARDHGIEHADADYDALIARSDIDLIYNGLPPSRHADLSIAALEAGKAVLCEKPFAMNAGEAERMVRAAQVSGRPLIEAFHYRYHPAFLRALEIVRSGQLGALRSLEAAFTVEIPYRPGELRHEASLGGGALMDLGCYPLHWARTLLAGEPSGIKATARQDRPGVDVTMTATATIGGIPVRLHTNMAPGAERAAWLKLEGEAGTLEMQNPLAPHLGHSITIAADTGTATETVEGQSTYDHQLAHVIDVLSASAPMVTGGEDAIHQMQAIDAIYTAAGMSPRGL